MAGQGHFSTFQVRIGINTNDGNRIDLFFLAYVLSPNINDIRATTKIQGLIMNGAMMFVAYYTIVHSSKIENEILTQCLFLASILFLVHNMNLLGIRPNNFFDYEWHRKGAGLLLGMKNDDLYMKFVNYQVVGMNTLFGISMYLAKLKIQNLKSSYIP